MGWRTSDLQDAGLPGRLSGESGSRLSVPRKLLGKCQVTTWGSPALHIAERSWGQGTHVVQVISPVKAEPGLQASGMFSPGQWGALDLGRDKHQGSWLLLSEL